MSATITKEELSRTLPRTREILARLGNPQGAFPAIHVTGTRGKSSVVAFLEGILSSAGHRVGVFSPSSPPGTEVRISGDPVSGETLRPFLEEARRASRGGARPVELLCAASFLLFAEVGVEIALVGAEIGGRKDLTNCLPRKILTLVSSLTEGRPELFGGGIERASWEEASTASPGVPLLTVERDMEALAVFAERLRERGAALVMLDPEAVWPERTSWEGFRWRLGDDSLGLREFITRPLGLYQRENLALTLGAVGELLGGWDISPEHIRRGLLYPRLDVRFEVVSWSPYVVLDRARTPREAKLLVETLKALPDPGGRKYLLFIVEPGIPPTVDLLEGLVSYFDATVVCAGELDGGLPLDRLEVELFGGDPTRAWEEISGELEPDDLVLVLGPKPALMEVRGAIGRPPS